MKTERLLGVCGLVRVLGVYEKETEAKMETEQAVSHRWPSDGKSGWKGERRDRHGGYIHRTLDTERGAH